jgi:RNA polymerase sigma-54 factor
MREMVLDHSYGDLERKILEEIVGNLDPWGFLRESTAAIAARMDTGEKQVNAIRLDLQNFDGRGIGSMHFVDFLRFQLIERIAAGGDAMDRSYLQAIGSGGAGGDFIRSMRRLKKNLSDSMFISLLGRFQKNVLRIHPRDGQSDGMGGGDGGPDIYVSLGENGEIHVAVPSDIGDSCLALGEKWNQRSVNELCAAVALREDTLRRIGGCIFCHQKMFLRHGISQLRSIKQSQIAEEMGLSIPSVSRALAGKYVKTPHGTFPLADFATWDLRKAASYVTYYICRLIEESVDFYFLSNQKMADLIYEKFHILFSRKTIARFRFSQNAAHA